MADIAIAFDGTSKRYGTDPKQLTLLARDFRTANNLSGAFVVPALLLTVGTLGAVAGPARTYVLAVILLALGAVAIVAALRWVSFERYLELDGTL